MVWIVLDAAWATSFGVYGNPLGASPAIDRFAADATVFERAYCQVPRTLGSVASYLTGKYPWKREARIEARQSLGQVPRSWPFPVELRRVFATICDVLGVRSCRRPDESLLIAIRNEPRQDRPVFAISELANGTPLKGLILGNHKLVGMGERFEHLILYDLDTDSQEKNDLAAQRPEVTRTLGEKLRRARLERVTLQESTPIRDETRQRLEALGYGATDGVPLGVSTGARGGALR